MLKHLFFICPTDHLEKVINDTFQHENYYITSLGNSIAFDDGLIEGINAFITTKEITEVTFVLSTHNSIVIDALRNQDFTKVSGLGTFYDEIVRQKRRAELTWKTFDLRIAVLSYHLNKKVQELITESSRWQVGHLKVNAKIYNRQKDVFSEVFSDLIYNPCFSLN